MTLPPHPPNNNPYKPQTSFRIMEICDNCGKTFKYILEGGGDLDEGYYCSDECAEEIFDKNYPDS